MIQECFWPYSLNECCFFIFYLWCQECLNLLNPSELLQKFTSLLTIPCSSCSKTWNEMLHLVDESLKLLSISHRGKYIYISIFLALLSSFQFLVSSGILQSGVLAAAKGEQILCYWNVFTDLLFCILCFGIQLICDVVKSSSSQMPMIAS